MQETFKDIPGFEGLYQVSDLGRIKSIYYNKGKILVPLQHDKGYFQIILFKDQRKKQYYIHRLVAQSFITEHPEDKININHKNGIKTDNHVDNLEWVTPAENNVHAVLTGLNSSIREMCPPKLSKLEVLEIRFLKLFAPWLTHKQLGRYFKIVPSHVSHIVNYKSWEGLYA